MRTILPLRSFSCRISSPFQKQLFAALVIILSWGAISSRAATIIVPNGGDLQSAINAANFGDTIILAAGGTYRAPGTQVAFSLAAKFGGTGTAADYITITTSNLALLPSGRVSIADRLNMAKIVAIGGRGAFQIAPNAKYWKLVGLEITNSSSGTEAEHVQDLLGSSDSGYSRNSKSAHFIIDRCYIHPQEDGLPTSDPNYKFRTASHGVAWNVADLTISNSRLSGFFGTYRHAQNIAIDSEAIAYSTGPGPLTVHNNFIDAWYAGILTGGADSDTDNFGTITSAQSNSVFTLSISGGSAPVAGDMLAVANPGREYSACKVGSVSGNTVSCQSPLVWNAQQNTGGPDAMAPAPVPVVGQSVKWRGFVMNGISLTRNTFNIDATFAQYWRTVSGNNPKGYIEFKNGVNILMDGNIFDGYPSSVGFGLQNQSGSAPWSAIRNVTLRNNLFRRFSYAFGPMSITGYSRLTETGGNVLITNNLVYGPGGEGDVNGHSSAFFTVGTADGYFTVTHNTVIDSTGGFTNQFDRVSGTGTFKDNIFYAKDYGNQCLVGSGHITNCFQEVISTKNLIVNNRGLNTNDIQSYWWSNSTIISNTGAVGFANVALHDYRLLSTSPGYRSASDGKDMGVDIDALNAALGGAPPAPTPTPTPNPIPTPTPTPTPNPTPTPTPAMASILVTAPTGSPLRGVSNGTTINLAELSTRSLSINIVPTTPVGSVKVQHNGQETVENVAPYSLAGDTNGEFNPADLSVGIHTLTVTPYSRSNLGGTPGTPVTITFAVVDNPNGTPPTLLTELNSDRAIAVNAATFVAEPFSLFTRENFGSDKRTRVMLIVANFESSSVGSDTIIYAENSALGSVSLPIEHVGKVPGFDWLTQVTVLLPQGLANAGDVWVRVVLRGLSSNQARISIREPVVAWTIPLTRMMLRADSWIEPKRQLQWPLASRPRAS